MKRNEKTTTVRTPIQNILDKIMKMKEYEEATEKN